ncbi:hypothetical protein DHW03_11880 [Pedobacter yonginense]|uniref:Uncharacterized protein n=1 Tax=Pedobacter yonginense TaxID=651869 RepID=A0A317EKQ5_9SPHI|nr:hypothetical protein [Pedobacter yonginense]PWS26727.1 hypothetical protein DHW03_11880 [Pedobacter yonginense]
MKLNLKYIVVVCIATLLILKVGNVMAYFKFSAQVVCEAVSNDDAEKEEKKIESEVLYDHFSPNIVLYFVPKSIKKIAIPDSFLPLSYFPEVLTPPPSV